MKNDYKQRWLEALRSGEYSQGRHVLHNRDNNAYCCLGVLCDLVVPESGRFIRDTLTNNPNVPNKVTAFINEGDYTVLPSVVMNTVRLSSASGNLHYEITLPNSDIEGLTLTNLNDSGFTFNQIADIIDYFIPGE